MSLVSIYEITDISTIKWVARRKNSKTEQIFTQRINN